MRKYINPQQHRLSQVDPTNRTAICAVCGPVPIQRKGTSLAGSTRWRCAPKDNSRVRVRAKHEWRRPFRERWLKSTCELCGFVPQDDCQLDIHHVDGNHSNNDPDNLETLCANCHRLVTKQQRVTKN